MTDDLLDFDASHFVRPPSVLADGFEDELPEIIRIKGLISTIEDELSVLEQSDATIISIIPKDDDSDDGLALECEDNMDLSYFPDLNASLNSVVSPVRNVTFNLDNGEGLVTPIRSPLGNMSLTDMVKRETPNSKVDAFLEMLRKAGYTYLTAKELADAAAARREGLDNSELSETCRDYFFTPRAGEKSQSSKSHTMSPTSPLSPSDSSTVDFESVDIRSEKAPAALSASAIEDDLRLKADFSVWNKGLKCSVAGVRECYIGLNDTSLSHDVVQGVLVAPELSPKGGASGGGGGGDKFSSPSKFSAPLNTTVSSVTSINGGGFYSVHALECLMRPDVLLTSIMQAVIKVAKQYHHKIMPQTRSHLILSHTKTHRNSFENIINNITNSGSNSGPVTAEDLTSDMDEASIFKYQQQAAREYDLIDIQVCISKELRQRVLFVQFLKKVPVLKVAALGGLLINSLAGSQVVVKPLSESPATKLLMSQLKVEIVNNCMSLSSLYSANLVSVCSLPTGLDTHFKAQLHTLVRDAMWTKLEADYKNMEGHVTEQEVECTAFTKSLEFIFKQYNISMPNPFSLQKKLHPSNRAAAPSPVMITASDMPSTPVKLRTQSEDENDSPAPAAKSGSQHTSFEDSVDALLTLRSVSTPEDFRQLTDNHKGHPQPDTSGASTPSTPVVGAVQDASNISGITNPDGTPGKSSARKKGASNNSTPSAAGGRKVDSGYVNGISSARKLDGMTFCLVMLDKCFQELQRECDAEYSARMQQRNALTVQMIDDIFDYKQSLLSALVNQPNVMQSNVMRKYQAAFKGIPVTTSMDMHIDLCTAPAKALPATKSWVVGGAHKPTGGDHPSDGLGLPHARSETNLSEVVPPSPSSGPTNWLWGSKPPTPSHKPPAGSHHNDQHHLKPIANPSKPVSEFIVLFYCTCMVSKVPATLYITNSSVSIDYNNTISSWMQYAGGTSGGEAVTVAKSGKEVYPLKVLSEISLTTLGSGMVNALSLVFNFEVPSVRDDVKNSRELIVSPAMDCNRLKAIILEVKRRFIVQPTQHHLVHL